MFDTEEFKRLILARKNTYSIDDFAIDIACKNTIRYLCQNDEVFDGFVGYMKREMTIDEYIYLSEISNDLSGIHPSLEFVEAYKSLAQKYPKETIEWQIDTFIEDADRLVNYFLKNEEARVKRLKEWYDNDPDFIKPYLKKIRTR